MNPTAQAIRYLGIDQRKKPGQTTKSCLNVAARAAEPIVKIKMPECRVEVITVHQNHHPATKPDAFRVSRRTVEGLGSFNELVGFVLIVLGCIGRRFAGLILGAKVAALGEGGSGTDQKCKPGNGEVTQNRILNIQHPWTHKFPDLLPARSPPDAAV
jgi:hypothetical protein